MGTIHVSAEGPIAAPAPTVYTYLADMREHQQFLPPAFSDFEIQSGSVGTGTVTRVTPDGASCR